MLAFVLLMHVMFSVPDILATEPTMKRQLYDEGYDKVSDSMFHCDFARDIVLTRWLATGGDHGTRTTSRASSPGE